MKKIGLVLAGGGGKGAYQIGVWKALREYGIDKNIHAVAGTSVGALNAALFAQGDLAKAEHVWLNISPEKILTIDPTKFLNAAAKKLPKTLFSVVGSLGTSLVGQGWFSRDGLLEIIRQDLDLSLVSDGDIACYSTCLHADRMEAKYFKLNGSSHERIKSILLASSAIPYIFDPVEIDSELYWDGGVPYKKADNLPIRPLYEEGCDLIFVVHLNRESVIEHEKFPNARVIEIIPQEHQGSFWSGTLDFSAGRAERRMGQGYDDTVRILQPILEMATVQREMGRKLREIRANERAFQQQRNIHLTERERLQQDLYQYIRK